MCSLFLDAALHQPPVAFLNASIDVDLDALAARLAADASWNLRGPECQTHPKPNNLGARVPSLFLRVGPSQIDFTCPRKVLLDWCMWSWRPSPCSELHSPNTRFRVYGIKS